MIRDHQHGHQDHREQARKRADPDGGGGQAAQSGRLHAGGAAGERGDGGVDDDQDRGARGVDVAARAPGDGEIAGDAGDHHGSKAGQERQIKRIGQRSDHEPGQGADDGSDQKDDKQAC